MKTMSKYANHLSKTLLLLSICFGFTGCMVDGVLPPNEEPPAATQPAKEKPKEPSMTNPPANPPTNPPTSLPVLEMLSVVCRVIDLTGNFPKHAKEEIGFAFEGLLGLVAGRVPVSLARSLQTSEQVVFFEVMVEQSGYTKHVSVKETPTTLALYAAQQLRGKDTTLKVDRPVWTVFLAVEIALSE